MLRDAPGYPSDSPTRSGEPAVPVESPGLSSRLRPGGRRARGSAAATGSPTSGSDALSTIWSAWCSPSTRPVCRRGRSRRLLLMSAPVRRRHEVLARRIRFLVAATITYNLVEAVVALAEGNRCRVGPDRLCPRFGDRGLIGGRGRMAVLRQVPGHGKRPHCGSSHSRSSRSPRCVCRRCAVAAGFGEAGPLMIGIVLAAASLAVMPVLSSRSAVPALNWARPRRLRIWRDAALPAVGGAAGRSGAERPSAGRGRIRRGVGHRRGGGSRRPECLAGDPCC